MQYLFFPFAFLMGVAVEDCRAVSRLIGTKIFVNEFVAYTELGKTIMFIKNNITDDVILASYKNGTLTIPNDITMIWEVKLFSSKIKHALKFKIIIINKKG